MMQASGNIKKKRNPSARNGGSYGSMISPLESDANAILETQQHSKAYSGVLFPNALAETQYPNAVTKKKTAPIPTLQGVPHVTAKTGREIALHIHEDCECPSISKKGLPKVSAAIECLLSPDIQPSTNATSLSSSDASVEYVGTNMSTKIDSTHSSETESIEDMHEKKIANLLPTRTVSSSLEEYEVKLEEQKKKLIKDNTRYKGRPPSKEELELIPLSTQEKML
jgi:hypothetical protein